MKLTINSNLFFSNILFLFLFLFLLLLLPLWSYAGNHDRGLLFSIDRDDTPVSYIFGSIHSGDPRVLRFSQHMLALLDDSDQFMMEVKIDRAVIFQSLTGMWLMDGSKLVDVIGDDLYQLVVRTGEQAGMPEMTFTYMKPWVVMLLFSLPPGNYQQIVDLELMERAAGGGLKIIGLETIQEQFDVFERMSIEDQKILLENTLKNYKLLSTQFEKLFKAYLDRDLARLQQIAGEQMQLPSDAIQVTQRLMKRLLDDRNQRMLERMLPEITANSNFIVVGALHLPGENGLLNLLEHQGFRISMVE